MTPQLRFPQFTDEWQVEKLGDIFDVRDGTHESPQYFESGKPLITSKNLQPDGRLDLNNVSYISQVDFENINKRSKVDIGDVLFGMIGTIGNPVRVLSDDFAIKNVALIKQRSLPTEYLIQYLNSPIITKQFHQKNAGGTQKFIALGDIRLLNIGIASKYEQEKIAEFLTVVDERIGKIEKKLELLQQYEKGVMQKIFSQQVRFKDDNGNPYPDWEEKKLSDVLKERNTQTPISGEYPLMAFVAYKGVAPKGDRYNREFLVSDAKSKKYKQTQLGDFIYSSNNLETGSIGLNLYGSASISPVYSIFETKDGYSHQFLGAYLTRKKFIYQMVRYRQGVVYGQWRIHESEFLKIEEKFPCTGEQQKIATFLTALDDKIKAEQTRLAAAKQWKKGLLQRMFV